MNMGTKEDPQYSKINVDLEDFLVVYRLKMYSRMFLYGAIKIQGGIPLDT